MMYGPLEANLSFIRNGQNVTTRCQYFTYSAMITVKDTRYNVLGRRISDVPDHTNFQHQYQYLVKLDIDKFRYLIGLTIISQPVVPGSVVIITGF